jgi:spermidine synthase
VPSFGDWGFVLAAGYDLSPEDIEIRVPTRYLDDRTASGLFTFEKDLRAPGATSSTLDQPLVLNYYLDGWKHWN